MKKYYKVSLVDGYFWQKDNKGEYVKDTFIKNDKSLLNYLYLEKKDNSYYEVLSNKKIGYEDENDKFVFTLKGVILDLSNLRMINHEEYKAFLLDLKMNKDDYIFYKENANNIIYKSRLCEIACSKKKNVRKFTLFKKN